MEIDAPLAQLLLDQAAEERGLDLYFPALQCSVPIDGAGIRRLRFSLREGTGPVSRFDALSFGRASETIPPVDLKDLLLEIATEADGAYVALHILSMRIFGNKKPVEPELAEAGRILLPLHKFDKSGQRDHTLALVARHCLIGECGAAAAKAVCANLLHGIAQYKTVAFNNSELINVILQAQPKIGFDLLLTPDAASRVLGRLALHERDVFEKVDTDMAVAWCREDPARRFPLMAEVVPFKQKELVSGKPAWTNIAKRVLREAPNGGPVLRAFTKRFAPSGWSGSRAAIMENNMKLLDDVDPECRELAEAAKHDLMKAIAEQHDIERSIGSNRDERFE